MGPRDRSRSGLTVRWLGAGLSIVLLCVVEIGQSTSAVVQDAMASRTASRYAGTAFLVTTLLCATLLTPAVERFSKRLKYGATAALILVTVVETVLGAARNARSVSDVREWSIRDDRQGQRDSTAVPGRRLGCQ